MSLNALPDEIIYKIFVDNNLTYRDAQNLRKGLEDVDPELSERIHSLIISPFTDSYLFHHLELFFNQNMVQMEEMKLTPLI